MNTKPIPDGYHTVTPSLTIRGAADAIDFYKRAFNAIECYRVAAPDGKIMHAEIRIGDSVVMVSEEFPEWGALGPQSLGGSATTLRLYVDDVDSLAAQAVAAGCTVLRPVENQFWGDRTGMFVDSFGHRWSIASHVEDVSPDEIRRRMSAFMQSGAE
jgi:PhnB protein